MPETVIGEASPGTRRRALPRPGSGLPARRRGGALALTVVGLPVLTGVLVALRDTLALESVLLLYLSAVVLVAVIGGWLPALPAAVASFLLANFFFTRPYHTFMVESRDSLIALIVFVLVAITVSLTVDVAARLRVSEARSRIEADALARITAAPARDTSLTTILDQVRDTFGMTSVALLERRGERERVAAHVGPTSVQHPVISIDAGRGLRLVADGPELFAEDRRVLDRLTASAARAWETQQLAGEAAQARHLAEIDQVRSALLAAVGHDLRTPLAGIKAAVSGLRQHDVTLEAGDQDELLAAIDESADQLDDLIANLLAMSRLQAGALSVTIRPIALDEVVARALIDLHDTDTTVCVPDDLPLVLADPGLLERVVANLVSNARRFTPPGTPVRVQASETGNADGRAILLQVIDTGPGVPETDWTTMFAPFQRLGDRPTGDGVGLGLAIARGFTEAMNAALTPSYTPGGGLTMTLALPVAP